MIKVLTGTGMLMRMLACRPILLHGRMLSWICMSSCACIGCRQGCLGEYHPPAAVICHAPMPIAAIQDIINQAACHAAQSVAKFILEVSMASCSRYVLHKDALIDCKPVCSSPVMHVAGYTVL